MIAFVMVSALSAAPVLTVPALPSEPIAREMSCRLGDQTFTLKLSSEYGPTGSSSIVNIDQRVRIDGWFAWERVHFENEPPAERVRFECDGQKMRVLFDSGRFVDWVVEKKTHSLVPSAALGEELDRLWAAAPEKVGARVVELSGFFDGLIDNSPNARISLLKARDAMNRGDLANAEALLEMRTDVSWRAVLLAELARLRESAPYRLVEGAKIGVAQWQSPLLEQDEMREYFWQGARFCVVQQDGSKTMRCFDSHAKKWSERIAAISVPFVPHIPNVARRQFCSRDSKRCVSCYSFFDALPDGSWIGVEDGRLWLALHPAEGSRLETLSEEGASARISHGFGGLIFGGSRFVFQGDTFTAAPVAKPGNTWHPLPEAPHGWKWENVLVSPDQQFVAAFARADAEQQGEWWLFRIAENR